MQRGLPFVVASALAAAGVGSAYAVNRLVASRVAPPEGALQPVAAGEALAEAEPPPSGSKPPLSSRTKSDDTYVEGILRRNIFDPDFIDTYRPSDKPEALGAKLSDLPLKLLGTVVSEPDTYSSALIAEEGREGEARGYGIEQQVMGATIVAIEPKLVRLRLNGEEEVLTMDEDGSSSRTSSPSDVAVGEEGISKVGDNKYVISRDLVDKYIGDLEAISRMGRALLHRGPDGQFDGYRLSAIRRNTMADKLGIRNGDVVHMVNGQTLNSVQGAMNAYQGLMNENAFSFEITRRGERMTLEYEVQ